MARSAVATGRLTPTNRTTSGASTTAQISASITSTVRQPIGSIASTVSGPITKPPRGNAAARTPSDTPRADPEAVAIAAVAVALAVPAKPGVATRSQAAPNASGDSAREAR